MQIDCHMDTKAIGSNLKGSSLSGYFMGLPVRHICGKYVESYQTQQILRLKIAHVAVVMTSYSSSGTEVLSVFNFLNMSGRDGEAKGDVASVHIVMLKYLEKSL